MKHLVRLSQICTPSSDQETALGEVNAKFSVPAMDIAKFITVCKVMNAKLPNYQ